jgi:hypothetical protein
MIKILRCCRKSILTTTQCTGSMLLCLCSTSVKKLPAMSISSNSLQNLAYYHSRSRKSRLSNYVHALKLFTLGNTQRAIKLLFTATIEDVQARRIFFYVLHLKKMYRKNRLQIYLELVVMEQVLVFECSTCVIHKSAHVVSRGIMNVMIAQIRIVISCFLLSFIRC